MKPNKLHIIFQIFGFLILSIGILYICQFFTKTFEEGFQSVPLSRDENIKLAECTLERDNSRDVILCPNSNAANTISMNASINLPKTSDNVCILTGDPSDKYYTCYTQPHLPIFNDTYGVYRDFDIDIDEDNLAFELVPSIGAFCASYITNTIKINRGIQSTQIVYNRVMVTEFSTMRYINELSEMKRKYCNPILPYMEEGCSNILKSYTDINSLFGSEGIAAAKRVTSNSIDTLSNISTKTFALYGSICKESSQYSLAEFVDIVEPTPILTFTDNNVSGI